MGTIQLFKIDLFLFFDYGSMMKNTDEQNAIIESSVTTKSLVVNALAGSGKTSTAIQCVKANSHKNLRIIYLCYNRSVSQTMKAKLDKIGVYDPYVTTFHSLAYKIKALQYTNAGREIGNIQPHSLVEHFRKDFFYDKKNGGKLITDKYLLIRCCRLLCSRLEEWCRSASFDIKSFLKNDKSFEYLFSLRNYGIEEECLDRALAKLWNIIFAHGDIPMPHGVYLKLFQLEVPDMGFDLAIIDEAQDMSPVNESIVRQFQKQGTRTIFFGDRYQQIYTWNGSVNAIQRFEPTSLVLTLSQSFRCPDFVVKEATKYLRLLGFEGTFKPAPQECKLEHKSPLVISRTNASLLANINACGAAFKYIHLVGGVKSYNFSAIQDYMNFIRGKKEFITSPVVAALDSLKDYNEYVEATNDVEMKNAQIIVQSLGPHKIGNLLHSISKGEFSEDPKNAKICFSTGHKCKGSEFERVQIDPSFSNILNDYIKHSLSASSIDEGDNNNIFRHLIKTTKGAKSNSFVFSAEELRLAYVSLTRSTGDIFPGNLALSDEDVGNVKNLLYEKDIILADLDENGNLQSSEDQQNSITMRM